MYEIGALAALDDFFSAPSSDGGRRLLASTTSTSTSAPRPAPSSPPCSPRASARAGCSAPCSTTIRNFFPARRTDIYRFDVRQGLGILRDLGGILLSAAARAVRGKLDLGRAASPTSVDALPAGIFSLRHYEKLPRALLAPPRAADALRRGAARALHHRQRSRLGPPRHLRAGRARRHSDRQGDLRLVGDPAVLRAGALQRARLHRRRRRQGGARRHRAGARRRSDRRRQPAGAVPQRSRSRGAADAAGRRAPPARQGHARGLRRRRARCRRAPSCSQGIRRYQASHPHADHPAGRAARRRGRHVPVTTR